MERGDTLNSRRRMLTLAVPAAAALVVVVGLAVTRPDGPGIDDGAADPVLALDAAALDWSTSPATLLWPISTTSADGIMYVLSTAPGARFEDFPAGRVPEAIYASADGVAWTSHPTGGTWVNSLAAGGGLLYAVGTAPGATADSVTVQVGLSRDQGATFDTSEIPVQTIGDISAQAIANDQGLLVLTNSSTVIDPWALLPPEVLAGDANPYQLDRGIAVFRSADLADVESQCFSSEGCPDLIEDRATYFASWDELGIDPELAGDRQEAFFSTDGKGFEEIDYPLPPGFLERAVVIDGVAVASVSAGMSQLLASDDLRTWVPIAQDAAIGWTADIGKVGDEYVLVGSTDGSRPDIYRSDDLFGAWERVPFEVMGENPGERGIWFQTAAVGEGGVALALAGETSAAAGNPFIDLFGRVLPAQQPNAGSMVGAVFVSSDLATWSAVTSSDIGVSGFVESARWGPDGTLTLTGWGDGTTELNRWQASAKP